jgi:hypothetical protein
VTFTATVSPVPDAGRVVFQVGNGALCDPPVDLSTGKATCQWSFTPPGEYDIQALYTGSNNYGDSGSAVLRQQVYKAPTSTSLSSSPNPSTAGQHVTYTATVDPVPGGGYMKFTDGGNTIPGCDMVQVIGASAACGADYGVIGSHSIVATYAENGGYFGSTSTTLTQSVGVATTSTALSSSSNPSAVGQQVTYTASVSPAPDGGTVAFTDGSATISGCGSVAIAGGKASSTAPTRVPAATRSLPPTTATRAT